MITRTHTRTVNAIDPANPYLRCDTCGAPVEQFLGVGEEQGPSWNEPCGHVAGATSCCPSWSPVDGCNCLDHLGSGSHD